MKKIEIDPRTIAEFKDLDGNIFKLAIIEEYYIGEPHQKLAYVDGDRKMLTRVSVGSGVAFVSEDPTVMTTEKIIKIIDYNDNSDETPQSEIFNAIGAYLIEKKFPGTITRSSDLVRTHGLDSLDIMEFTTVMEDKFDVEIPDVELKEATREGYRIQTIIELIESAQNG